MQHAYRDHACAKIPMITVTAAERDWMYAERRRAMKECPDLVYQKDRRDPKKAMGWRSELHIHGRAPDGCLEVSVVISPAAPLRVYKRKLRVPSRLGSTSRRDIHLRQNRRAS